MHLGVRTEGTCHTQGGRSQTGWARAANPTPQDWEALAEPPGSLLSRGDTGVPGERDWTKAPEVEPMPTWAEAAAVPEATEGI